MARPLLLLLLVLTAFLPSTQQFPARLPSGLKVRGLDGNFQDLGSPPDGVLALVFLWSECPISNRYSPTLNELQTHWQGRPVRLLCVYVDPDHSDSELRKHAEEFQLVTRLARDNQCQVAQRLGVEVVPSSLVIDSTGTIRYRGRIDDQFFALGKSRVSASTHDLRNAVDAILSGKPVSPVTTEPVGCTLPTP